MTETLKRTELLFVRHGETESNVLGLLHGRTDVPLSPMGLRQAGFVAERLVRELPIDAIYSSPLVRAWTTAEAIAERLALLPRARADLAELDFGDAEGYTLERLAEDFPEMYHRYVNARDPDAAFPNGETGRHFHARVQAAIGDIIDAHPKQRVIIVAHGGVIFSGVSQLMGEDPNNWQRYQVSNCSVTHLELGPDNDVIVRCLNDISHLSIDGGVEQ